MTEPRTCTCSTCICPVGTRDPSTVCRQCQDGVHVGEPRTVRYGIVTSRQIGRCPNKILTAEHWINVPPGGDCSCLQVKVVRTA